MTDILQFSRQNERDLDRILRKVKGMMLGEVGCWTGKSTSIIAMHAKKTGAKVYAIDWFKGSIGTETEKVAKTTDVYKAFMTNMSRLGLDPYIAVLKGNSVEVAEKIPNEFFNFLFIDGDHRYKSVKKDIEAYLPKMRADGIISGHDFESLDYNDEQTGTEFYQGKHHGLIKAVREKFDGYIRRKGNIWYVNLAEPRNWITRLKVKIENFLEPEFSYIAKEYDYKWGRDY